MPGGLLCQRTLTLFFELPLALAELLEPVEASLHPLSNDGPELLPVHLHQWRIVMRVRGRDEKRTDGRGRRALEAGGR